MLLDVADHQVADGPRIGDPQQGRRRHDKSHLRLPHNLSAGDVRRSKDEICPLGEQWLKSVPN